LPEADGIDDTGRWQHGEFSHARGAFEGRLRRSRVPARDVHIVEGFYDRSLADPDNIPLRQVAIAWIDCDLYSSTVPVLDYLTPRLSQGAIILFDDWFTFQGDPDRGEQRASREWLERNPDISLVPWRQFHWAGQAFIFRRAEADA
jgi:O-methyltransferase